MRRDQSAIVTATKLISVSHHPGDSLSSVIWKNAILAPSGDHTHGVPQSTFGEAFPTLIRFEPSTATTNNPPSIAL